MEGTLTEEIWQQVAEDTGIEDFAKTTRDVPSYSELMDERIQILKKEGITLRDILFLFSVVSSPTMYGIVKIQCTGMQCTGMQSRS